MRLPERPFEIASWELTTQWLPPGRQRAVASVTLKMDGMAFAAQHTREDPVDALESALRGCLQPLYPVLHSVRSTGYRVRSAGGTFIVVLDWVDGDIRWSTSGESANVIEAMWNGIETGIRLALVRSGAQPLVTVADDSWAV